METLNWKDFFRHHPIFFSLPEIGVKQLLEDKASEEHRYSQGTVIFKEGDNSKSVYLIGTGSVSIGSKELDPYQNASFLTKGDFFGESILIDQRPRTASVVANEDCVLLEIRGHKFVPFLNEYPDIQSKVLLKLGERLRGMNDRLLAVDVHGVDERLKHFNTKLDTEIKAIDSSLRSAQVVFDQTKLRTDEIIRSAERRQTTFASIGSVLTLIFAFLGFLGFTNFEEMTGDFITKTQGASDKVLDEARTNAILLNKLVDEFEQKLKKIENTSASLSRLALGLAEKEYYDLENKLIAEIENGTLGSAGVTYNNAISKIKEVKKLIGEIEESKELDIDTIDAFEGQNKVLHGTILSNIKNGFLDEFLSNEAFNKNSDEYKQAAKDLAIFLDKTIGEIQHKNIKTEAYYLLLASATLGEMHSINKKDYSEVFNKFKVFLEKNKGEIADDTIGDLTRLFEEKPEIQQIRELLDSS